MPTNFYIEVDFSIVNESGVKSPVFSWVNFLTGLLADTSIFNINIKAENNFVTRGENDDGRYFIISTA